MSKTADIERADPPADIIAELRQEIADLRKQVSRNDRLAELLDKDISDGARRQREMAAELQHRNEIQAARDARMIGPWRTLLSRKYGFLCGVISPRRSMGAILGHEPAPMLGRFITCDTPSVSDARAIWISFVTGQTEDTQTSRKATSCCVGRFPNSRPSNCGPSFST
jgi:hypothetical protein